MIRVAFVALLAVAALQPAASQTKLSAADIARRELATAHDWEPLGAIAICYPAEDIGPREPAPADGLLIEVHAHPDEALSDGAQSLYPEQFALLMEELRGIAGVIGRRIS